VRNETEKIIRVIENLAKSLHETNEPGELSPATVCRSIVSEKDWDHFNFDLDNDGVNDRDELPYCLREVLVEGDMMPSYVEDQFEDMKMGMKTFSQISEYMDREHANNDTYREMEMEMVGEYLDMCSADCITTNFNDRMHPEICNGEMCRRLHRNTPVGDRERKKQEAESTSYELKYHRRVRALSERKRKLLEKKRRKLAQDESPSSESSASELAEELEEDTITINGETYYNSNQQKKRELIEKWAAHGVHYVQNTRPSNLKHRYLKSVGANNRALRRAKERAFASSGNRIPRKYRKQSHAARTHHKKRAMKAIKSSSRASRGGNRGRGLSLRSRRP
jgi:hypothetical protein